MKRKGQTQETFSGWPLTDEGLSDVGGGREGSN